MECITCVDQQPCLQHHLLPQPVRVKYTSVSDELVLEDFVQRVPLMGNIPTHQLVTGKAGDGEGDVGNAMN